MLVKQNAYEVAVHVGKQTGLVKELFNDKSTEGMQRYENIQELLNGIKDFVEQPRTPQEDELNDIIRAGSVILAEGNEPGIKTLDEFMQEITLLTSVDKEDEKDTDNNKVSLMTIHSAKGLEFPYVYIVGLEENLFPSQLSINSRTELEEERRLFYVALTRAEKLATLSFATMRYRFGNVTYCEPSRFIDEIDDRFIDYPEDPGVSPFADNVFEKFRENYKSVSRHEAEIQGSSSGGALNFRPAKKLVRLSQGLQAGNPAPVDTNLNKSLRNGDMVTHEKFGKGQIVQLDGSWPETKATILFEKAGNKSLLLKFARLQKV